MTEPASNALVSVGFPEAGPIPNNVTTTLQEQLQQQQQQQQTGNDCAKLKGCVKIFVIYSICLQTALLIFTAMNHEPMNKVQTDWWWAFICSLIVTMSMLTTCFVIICFLDHCYTEKSDEANKSTTGVSYKSVVTVNSVSASQDNISAKYLTQDALFKQLIEKSEQAKLINDLQQQQLIREQQQLQQLQQLQQQQRPQQQITNQHTLQMATAKSGFVNLTPSSSVALNENPVTIVDARHTKTKHHHSKKKDAKQNQNKYR